MHSAECRLRGALVTTSPRLAGRRAPRAIEQQQRFAVAIGCAASLIGTAAAIFYANAGLTLSHYDARAHLVVARRIIDSLTPGWQQIGAVWLPLPHLLNMLPVQIDLLYRTGASAVAISVASTGVAAWALASLIVRTTSSRSGAIAAVALLVLNPDVLYLQSTPMTEPLLFATTTAALALTAAWIDRGAGLWPHAAGGMLAAACLTRYEAWPVAACAVVLVGAVLLRRGTPLVRTCTACLQLAVWPAVAIALFLINSRWTVGAWFVSGGFFVVENTTALGHPLVAWEQVREGLYKISGTGLVWSAYAGAAIVAFAFLRSRSRAPIALLLALAGAAVLPCAAYVQGHPFRIRYDVPLVAACAALAGAGVSLVWSRVRPFVAAAVIAAALVQAGPLDPAAPMIAEAQLEAASKAGRRSVTEYLVAHRDGRTIMMSMGSLGHYMQDLSAEGFRIRDFLHEGNGDLWNFAVGDPRGLAGWIVIEERAEGGDALYREARYRPEFLAGFERVAQGGGVTLYRRVLRGSTGFHGVLRGATEFYGVPRGATASASEPRRTSQHLAEPRSTSQNPVEPLIKISHGA
jgi:hypothetical protein